MTAARIIACQQYDILVSEVGSLYSDTVSRYLPTSSLIENVEYSAEYHRPEVRWICVQTRLLHKSNAFHGVQKHPPLCYWPQHLLPPAWVLSEVTFHAKSILLSLCQCWWRCTAYINRVCTSGRLLVRLVTSENWTVDFDTYAGAQSSLGEHDIFARKMCMKN